MIRRPNFPDPHGGNRCSSGLQLQRAWDDRSVVGLGFRPISGSQWLSFGQDSITEPMESPSGGTAQGVHVVSWEKSQLPYRACSRVCSPGLSCWAPAQVGPSCTGLLPHGHSMSQGGKAKGFCRGLASPRAGCRRHCPSGPARRGTRSKEAEIGPCLGCPQHSELWGPAHSLAHTCEHTHAQTHATSHWLSGSEHLCEHPIPEG